MPTFPEVIDITFYWNPASTSFVVLSLMLQKFPSYAKMIGWPRYARDEMILCQQVILMSYLETRPEMARKLAYRKAMFTAIFNKLREEEQDKKSLRSDMRFVLEADSADSVRWFDQFLTSIGDGDAGAAASGGAGGRRKNRRTRSQRMNRRTRRQRR